MKRADLRSLPAVETVLQVLPAPDFPRTLAVRAVRAVLAECRREPQPLPRTEVLARIQAKWESIQRARLQPVINGTGVLLHTNLGRAPLAEAALSAMSSVARGYSNLELDLETGERGARSGYLEEALATLCAAEAATVVNNGAAALVLILRHFTAGERREVVISRGELVQIGGGFRIPDILETSGAVLREVGTTNRTTVRDYERAVGTQTAMMLKVHRSNFLMSGFVESASIAELALLARRKRLPLVEDLGSGAVVATERLAGLAHEPTPAESLRQGVDLVCCSGDKLFGGPQAGLILGKRRLVQALKREPFFRALRCDKLVFAALQATIEEHLSKASEQGLPRLPLLELLRTTTDQLRQRGAAILAGCQDLPLTMALADSSSQVGGGTLPDSALPSIALEMRPRSVSLNGWSRRLRQGRPPVIGQVAGQRYRLDLRTVFPDQDASLIEAIRRAASC